MTDGVVAQLQDLIDLRRYAHSVRYRPEHQAVRGGSNLSRLRGRGMDFAEVRNYQAGDEIRHMEWRVTARTGRPHVKLYQEERERPVIILVDFNPSMIFGTRIAFKSVVAARLAAMIAWTASQQGDRVGGYFFSATEHSEFMPRGRESGVLPMLTSLCDYTRQDDTQRNQPAIHLSEALIRIRRVIRPGSILVIISDFYSMDDEAEKQLARLRGHHDVLAYQINDPIELAPPPSNQYAMSNGQQEIILDTGVKPVAEAYQQFILQRQARMDQQFKKLQIQLMSLTAQEDIPQLVRQTYPRRTRV